MEEKNEKSKCSILFTMRIDEQTKQKLENLAANKVFKYNNSALVKYLIDAEHAKQVEQNGTN